MAPTYTYSKLLLIACVSFPGASSYSQVDNNFEKVRDVRVRYPEMTDVVNFMAVYPAIPILERAAIILEDSFITETFKEFSRRDADNDGAISFDELWNSIEEFNYDEDAVGRCHQACIDIVNEYNAFTSSESVPAGCTALAYVATRGSFDTHCQENEVNEMDAIEDMLMEMMDSQSKTMNPEDLGLQVDIDGMIVD